MPFRASESDYEKLIASVEPLYATLFNRIFPGGIDNAVQDFVSWASAFDVRLSEELKNLTTDDQVVVRGLAIQIKRFYARNCHAMSENQKKVAHFIEDLPDLQNKSNTVDMVYQIGNAILNRFVFRTNNQTKVIHRYDEEDGIFRSDGEVFIEQVIKSQGLKLSKHDIHEIVYHIQTSTYEESKNFNGVIIDNKLHVENGWLDMESCNLEPHTPAYLSTAKLSTSFNRNAGPIEFINIVNQALDPENRRLLFKVMGNILIQDCRFEKASLFVGDGHNRKSAILNAIRNVCGAENCASISLQEFANDKYSTADLNGKMLNLVFDLKSDRIQSSGRFKEAVSGDPIRAQDKYRKPFVFRPNAKHIFAANDIPASADQTNGYFRRWIIIVFYRLFERDATVQKRLSTPAERSGILNLMLAGRKMLLQEGFDDVPIEKIRTLYNKNASLVKQFTDQECIIDIGNDECRTLTYELQSNFRAYNEKKKGRKLSNSEADYLDRQLGQELKKLGIDNKPIRDRKTGERPRFYVGIMLKSKARSGSGDLTTF